MQLEISACPAESTDTGHHRSLARCILRIRDNGEGEKTQPKKTPRQPWHHHEKFWLRAVLPYAQSSEVNFIHQCARSVYFLCVWKGSRSSLPTFPMRMTAGAYRGSWAVSNSGKLGQERKRTFLCGHAWRDILTCGSFSFAQFLINDFLPFCYFTNSCDTATFSSVFSGSWSFGVSHSFSIQFLIIFFPLSQKVFLF